MSRKHRDRQIADLVTGQVDERGPMPGSANRVPEKGPAARNNHQDIESDDEEDDGDE